MGTVIKLGSRFHLPNKNILKVTEVFSQGLHYHTLNEQGDCIKPQQYVMHNHFLSLIKDHHNARAA